MLVTFKTRAFANIVMFGDVATQLLKLMGRSDTVPSAIVAEDVPKALERLRAGLAAAESESAAPDSAQAPILGDEEEGPVELSHRALPLIQLLEAAEKDKVAVMWEN